MCNNFSPSQRRALTLVEVLAALVIMGTLLAGMVMAKSGHTRQLARARDLTTATALAEELLTRWWNSPAGVPINQGGAIDAHPGWTWQTRIIENEAAAKLDARALRLDLFAPEAAEPALNVAILLPLPGGSR